MGKIKKSANKTKPEMKTLPSIVTKNFLSECNRKIREKKEF